MESLIINQKKLSVIVFICFSEARKFKDFSLQQEVTKDTFEWSFTNEEGKRISPIHHIRRDRGRDHMTSLNWEDIRHFFQMEYNSFTKDFEDVYLSRQDAPATTALGPEESYEDRLLIAFGNFMLRKHKLAEDVGHWDLENWKHDNLKS